LTPHDFTKQVNSNGATLPLDIAFMVIKEVQKSKEDSQSYLEFIAANGYGN